MSEKLQINTYLMWHYTLHCGDSDYTGLFRIKALITKLLDQSLQGLERKEEQGGDQSVWKGKACNYPYEHLPLKMYYKPVWMSLPVFERIFPSPLLSELKAVSSKQNQEDSDNALKWFLPAGSRCCLLLIEIMECISYCSGAVTKSSLEKEEFTQRMIPEG